jgi:hypothetical protein
VRFGWSLDVETCASVNFNIRANDHQDGAVVASDVRQSR